VFLDDSPWGCLLYLLWYYEELLPRKLMETNSCTESPPRGGGTPYSGLYREAPPQRGPFFKLAVYLRVGKIVILVYERVTKSAAK